MNSLRDKRRTYIHNTEIPSFRRRIKTVLSVALEMNSHINLTIQYVIPNLLTSITSGDYSNREQSISLQQRAHKSELLPSSQGCTSDINWDNTTVTMNNCLPEEKLRFTETSMKCLSGKPQKDLLMKSHYDTNQQPNQLVPTNTPVNMCQMEGPNQLSTKLNRLT